jgi:prefoldin subunit 5
VIQDLQELKDLQETLVPKDRKVFLVLKDLKEIRATKEMLVTRDRRVF